MDILKDIARTDKLPLCYSGIHYNIYNFYLLWVFNLIEDNRVKGVSIQKNRKQSVLTATKSKGPGTHRREK
jgi:hypothetical protein